MNQRAAICKSLLKGEVLSIMNGFKWFGCTNIPREIGRSVERPFGVIVSRVSKDGNSRYGQPVHYTEYRLNNTENNKEGRQKMIAYVSEIEQAEFKSIVKKGAKKKHVPENEPTPEPKPTGVPIQTDLFS
jgi:hypothetical protein